MLKKKESDIELYNKMINLSDYGYCSYLADKFERTHKYDKFGNITKWKYEIYEPEYINIMVTLDRYASDKTEFCDKSQKDEFVQELAIRKDRRIVKTAKTINERLLQMGIPYKINEKRTKRKIDGRSKDVRLWTIVRARV
ncbi:MAG: hypothetical protein U0J83_02850 [Bulleidia sp.]|nr:hypothetical protein [Bulleidia sp.]